MSCEFDSCNEDHYVGEENTRFYIYCGIDVSLATESRVLLKRPDGTKIQKQAYLTTYRDSPNFVYFTIDKSDFNQEGKYTGQVYLVIGAWSGWGQPFTVNVDAPISSSSSSSSFSVGG